jgi:hypothetical protein
MPPGTVCLITGPGEVADQSPLTLGTGSGLILVGGSLSVTGAVTVGADAVMATNTQTNSTPVDISGAVTVESDAVFILGTETPYGSLFSSIGGTVTGLDASSVQIHNSLVSGKVTLMGGGRDNALLEELTGGAPELNFNDLEDNLIGSSVTEVGYDGVWAGVLRNVIKGAMTFSDNSEAPMIDEYDIGSNVILGAATCSGNDPAPNLGESPGFSSIVYGPTLGDQAATCTGIPEGVSGPPV